MNQTKIESLIESILNVGSGFIIALCVWTWIIVPWWDIQITVAGNLMVTSLFTVISIVRGYIWRRFFNKGLHKIVHQAVRKVFA